VKVELLAIEGIAEVTAGDDLPALICDALALGGASVQAGDIFVVTQKVVSKSEGRTVLLADVEPSHFARQWASDSGLDARVVELVLRESRRVVRMDRGVLITETRHGFICANAGVDLSNVANGEAATLLPVDPDRSAEGLRTGLMQRTGVPLAVIVSDTFGRPWREGLTNVAVGVAGLVPLDSYIGRPDDRGLELRATIHATADEIAAAAGLVSTKVNRVPVVLVRGLSRHLGDGSAQQLVRAPQRDMFR
jgi:coenzyme F420-0:L-glutamate ligase/coenzyme F420-1:gamma-L-glutamate ligase